MPITNVVSPGGSRGWSHPELIQLSGHQRPVSKCRGGCERAGTLWVERVKEETSSFGDTPPGCRCCSSRSDSRSGKLLWLGPQISVPPSSLTTLSLHSSPSLQCMLPSLPASGTLLSFFDAFPNPLPSNSWFLLFLEPYMPPPLLSPLSPCFSSPSSSLLS